MATSKVTFTLDHDTVSLLDQSAAQLAIPKSQVVSRAIQDFHERNGSLRGREGRLSKQERLRMLKGFDEMMPRIANRPQRDVARELREIRESRQRGGRRTQSN